MFDYKLLESLERIAALRSFEAAAQELNISQSAISQRITNLEQRVGAILVQRGKNLTLTSTGQNLVNHAMKVKQLEFELHHLLGEGGVSHPLKIVINADSLATWWFKAIKDFHQQHNVMFDILIEDQSEGLKHLEEGFAMGCLCSSNKALTGIRCEYLGTMEYRFYCSPNFKKKYFQHRQSKQDLQSTLHIAPAVIFGADDKLQKQQFQKWGLSTQFPYHICPSSEGLAEMILNGQGYGILPVIQAKPFGDQLVDIFPEREGINVPLYWHYWHQRGSVLNKLADVLVGEKTKGMIK
ncbi:ArgP/LysG family DNA-binding transcriptional regulator [Vibrio algivorus]|uniref:ArgP/LysG family DNA-binding transcriptional regulator n=1 Tax=Vibrio algivorus TaxID=1667024 RepID=A0A557PBE9_9VIBR|nr:ArgP/LysG family DNA-binding transcriptional regulator [Vibrio algivorus]TVO37991.1 ArgP/LysG family DNA-binding transcriptional regulator [Vibrio algivorus]